MTRWRLLPAGAAALALLAAPCPASAAPADTVKVVVVRTAEQNGGRADSLPQIAGRTLGDPNRAQEIFDLNKGRMQGDGAALTDPNRLNPGWILRLPDDASGPDVRLGRVDAPAAKPYLTWKVVLALIGAVLLAALSLLVVFRRGIVGFARARFRRFAERARLRRRIRNKRRLRARLASEYARDRTAFEIAYRGVAELAEQGVEAYALTVGADRVTAWVTAERPPQPPWLAAGESRWTRDAGAGTAAGPGSGPACLVRPGGDEHGPFFVDLSWLDGVLSIGGDRQVAAAALHQMLIGLRPDVRVVAVRGGGSGPVDLPVPAVLVRAIGELLPVGGPAAAPTGEADGMVLLAARRRVLTGLVVVLGPIGAGDAARLLAHCGPGSGWAGVLLGDVPGAHWRWLAEADGSLHLPVFSVALTVPAAPPRGRP